MKWVWFFHFYAAVGFLLETGFALLRRRRLESRKNLLFLPLCPVYGLGAVLILLLPPGILRHPLWFFLCAAAGATAAEYLAALFYELCWGVRFWDYGQVPFQLHGRVCLPFSLLWGLLAFPLRSLAQPMAEALWRRLPPALTAGLTAALLADLICTTLVLERRRDPEALEWWN